MCILVQSTANPAEPRRLTLFNQQVEELITFLELNLNLNSVSESDITLAILKANKPIKISYDFNSKKVHTITI